MSGRNPVRRIKVRSTLTDGSAPAQSPAWPEATGIRVFPRKHSPRPGMWVIKTRDVVFFGRRDTPKGDGQKRLAPG